jgi:hypothetical protein
MAVFEAFCGKKAWKTALKLAIFATKPERNDDYD